MNDAQLLRYSRHLLLEEIDVEGQERLLASHAVIIGAGGLGSPAAMYLTSAGVGRLTLVDDDEVDLTNLQRQIAHTEARVGQPKTESMRTALQQINSDTQIRTLTQRADAELLRELARDADVMLDCTDNFATRQMVNQACVQEKTDLVWGAAIRFDAQIGVYRAGDAVSPCYACTFDPRHVPEEARCATMGVFAPITGIVGSIQAAEAIKLLCGLPSELHHAMLLINARHMAFSSIGLQRQQGCPVCGSMHA
ncbi:HesA/MoeB/ThiF family protein [Brachymonas denitrificans]|uniref:HesA/MoeB/ThiF family protein n=1 Tax=Brachymonas denitrificans TaxID=28220 RepID=UPI002AFE06A9|nr:HesA/MoeB/ThiF family protein [Brachymonas denitrificans]